MNLFWTSFIILYMGLAAPAAKLDSHQTLNPQHLCKENQGEANGTAIRITFCVLNFRTHYLKIQANKRQLWWQSAMIQSPGQYSATGAFTKHNRLIQASAVLVSPSWGWRMWLKTSLAKTFYSIRIVKGLWVYF